MSIAKSDLERQPRRRGTSSGFQPNMLPPFDSSSEGDVIHDAGKQFASKEELSAPPSYERVVPSSSEKRTTTTTFPCPSPVPWPITDLFLGGSIDPESKNPTTAFPDRIPEGGGPALPISNLNVTCQICGAADHHTAACYYLREIPRGVKIINDTQFKIVCQCGKLLVDGACHEGCPPHIPFKVIQTRFPWLTYTPIDNQHCRVTWFTKK